MWREACMVAKTDQKTDGMKRGHTEILMIDTETKLMSLKS